MEFNINSRMNFIFNNGTNFNLNNGTTFKLNIGTLNITTDEYKKLSQIFAEEKTNIKTAIVELTELGWSGEAKDKFLQAHEAKMKLYEELEDEIKYMINALEYEEKPRALQLKSRSEDFLYCIEGNASGGAFTSINEGIIALEYGGQFGINNNVNNCTNDDFKKMDLKLEEVRYILKHLEYTSFGIKDDVESIEDSIKSQTTSLIEFDSSFNTYCSKIKEMESNICSVFSKISVVGHGTFKNSSVISASGDIDKNQLRDVMLKNEDGLTDEDKAILAYLEKILGSDEYNKLKEIMTKNLEDLTDGEKEFLDNIVKIKMGDDVDKYEIIAEGTITNLTEEEAEQYIFYEPILFGKKINFLNKMYSSKEKSDLPEEISYEKDGYTYIYVLKKQQFRDFIGNPIEINLTSTKDGREFGTYSYELAYTNNISEMPNSADDNNDDNKVLMSGVGPIEALEAIQALEGVEALEVETILPEKLVGNDYELVETSREELNKKPEISDSAKKVDPKLTQKTNRLLTKDEKKLANQHLNDLVASRNGDTVAMNRLDSYRSHELDRQYDGYKSLDIVEQNNGWGNKMRLIYQEVPDGIKWKIVRMH